MKEALALMIVQLATNQASKVLLKSQNVRDAHMESIVILKEQLHTPEHARLGTGAMEMTIIHLTVQVRTVVILDHFVLLDRLTLSSAPLA